MPSGRVGVDIPLGFPGIIAIEEAAVAEAVLMALLEEAVIETSGKSVEEETVTLELADEAAAFSLKAPVAVDIAAVAVELLSASTVFQA